jgi:hypothetical protein
MRGSFLHNPHFYVTDYTSTHTPLEITQGTAHLWYVDAGDYTAAEGYAATLTIINSATSLSVAGTTSTDDPGDFDFALSIAQTAALYAGSYRYQITVTDGTNTYQLENGYIYVLEDVATAQPIQVSGKSPARQRLEHYQSLLMQESILKTLAPGQIEEIEQAMRRIEWDIKREEDAEKVKRSINATRKIYTRFI